MASRKDDLDKIGDVLLAFFDTKRIQETLNSIHELDITGWEKWWQTELALYLASAKNIAEWDMEHSFDTDKRTAITQGRIAIDIGFRLKKHSDDSWHFVELKQHNDYRACIDKMSKDAQKVFSARKRSFEGVAVRFIACAGMFLAADDDAVLDYAEEALEQLDVDSGGLYLENVGKHYSLLIF